MTIYWPDYVDSTCRSNVSYLASSEFMTTAYHATAIVTVPLSVFTFFVIIRVTPNKMKNMKTPLLIAHVWSTNLDLMLTVFLTPFMLFPSASGVIMGLFRLTGIHSKWLTYMGQVSIIMIGVNFVMLLENRHSQIATTNLRIERKRTRILYFAVNYFLAFFLIFAFYLEDSDQMELRQFVLKRISCPAIEFFDENTIVLLKGGELLPFLSISGGLLLIVGQSLFFSMHSVYHLYHVKNVILSENTRALQRKFLSYVVMQVTIPWAAVVSPILYSLYADRNDYYNQALNNISMLLMACHGLMSTICTLFIIKPYWEFVKSLLKRQNECHPNEMWTNNKPKESVASITNFQ